VILLEFGPSIHGSTMESGDTIDYSRRIDKTFIKIDVSVSVIFVKTIDSGNLSYSLNVDVCILSISCIAAHCLGLHMLCKSRSVGKFAKTRMTCNWLEILSMNGRLQVLNESGYRFLGLLAMGASILLSPVVKITFWLEG
jgi:hypothetical protein